MNDEKSNLRPIDKIRNGAGKMDIETEDDQSPIADFITNGDRLFVVKGKGIFEVKFADQIDPDRKNIATPNTAQRIMPYGIETPWIGSIIITSDQLFHSSCFPGNINNEEAFAVILEMSKYISALYKLMNEFTGEQKSIIERTSLVIQQRSFIVPSMDNIETKCHDFIIKSDHALSKLFSLVHLFYPEFITGGWEEFIQIVKKENRNDNFVDFLQSALPILQLIRSARNCAEHPNRNQKIETTDFLLSPENTLVTPTIKITHKTVSMNETPIESYFCNIFSNVVNIAEAMIAFLCERKAVPFCGMEIHVIELKKEQRRYESARYKYGSLFNGQIVPIG